MFSFLSFRIEHKKLLKTKQQCTFVYIMNLGRFGCYAALVLIFLPFLSGVQKYVWKDVIHTVILALKKSNIFILRKFCKRIHCPPIVTLDLLLFITKLSIFVPGWERSAKLNTLLMFCLFGVT